MINTGKYGELQAAQYLRRKKWSILSANFSCRLGEVDLIASNASYIAFVEVKTRDVHSIAQPLEFVDANKQRRLIQTAKLYLSQHPSSLQPRFDVIEVYTKDNKMVKLNHLEDAFRLN